MNKRTREEPSKEEETGWDALTDVVSIIASYARDSITQPVVEKLEQIRDAIPELQRPSEREWMHLQRKDREARTLWERIVNGMWESLNKIADPNLVHYCECYPRVWNPEAPCENKDHTAYISTPTLVADMSTFIDLDASIFLFDNYFGRLKGSAFEAAFPAQVDAFGDAMQMLIQQALYRQPHHPWYTYPDDHPWITYTRKKRDDKEYVPLQRFILMCTEVIYQFKLIWHSMPYNTPAVAERARIYMQVVGDVLTKPNAEKVANYKACPLGMVIHHFDRSIPPFKVDR